MTRPLTDEQLDKLRARVSTVHPPARIGKADAHEMMHNTPACVVYAIQDLFRRLDHEHAAHQVTQAELEQWKSLAEDAVERLAQYDDDYDLENGMDAGALANQDMIERLDTARAGEDDNKPESSQ